MNKIKVKVVVDEWFPVFEPSEGSYFEQEYEVPASLWKRYCKTFVQFSKVREELEEVITTSPRS